MWLGSMEANLAVEYCSCASVCVLPLSVVFDALVNNDILGMTWGVCKVMLFILPF